ncbi:MAG: GspE/PulE/PilB domain-containing protein, partial [Planctomycetota bacterium]
MNQVHPRIESAPAVLALVERLVRREVLSTEEVADLRGLRQLEAGDPNTNPNTDLLQTITLSGSAQARTIVVAACEEERVFDYLVADGFPFLPRLLRQLSLERLLALGALPTITLDGGKGPAIVVSSQPLAPADKKWLSAALGHPVASLYAPEAVVEPALREAYAQLNRRGRRDVRLGEVLVREHVIDEATRDQTLQRAAEEKLHFGEALVADGLLTEAELYSYLAAHKGLEFVTAQEVIAIFDRRVASSVRFEFVRHTRIVPFQKKDGAIRVVGSDPRADLGPLRQALGRRPVSLCLALPSDIDRILEHLSGPSPSKPDSKSSIGKARASEEQVLLDLEDVTPWSRDHEDVGQEKRARYVALADQLLACAITRRASDIHLEIYDNNEVLVR